MAVPRGFYSFVISAKAGLRRQDAEAAIGLADGPQGERQGRREYIQ